MSHLDIDITQTSWMDAASCASVDPLLFDQGDRGNANRYTDARKVCRRCPVAAQCLTHAIDRDERYGMWGGLTPEERDEIHVNKSRRMSALEARDDVNKRNALRLLRLPRSVQQDVMAGRLSMGHARALLPLEGGNRLQEARDRAARGQVEIVEASAPKVSAKSAPKADQPDQTDAA
jgi:WhiB family redox-sensing transcriptional regulator